jgi:hypothetical protein
MSALMILVVIEAFLLFPRHRSASLAHWAFTQIEPGMTRKEVWHLMQGIPDADGEGGYIMDFWEFGNKWEITVHFFPDNSGQPGSVDEQDPEGQNWKVTKVSLDSSETNPIEKFLMDIGLWSQRRHLTKP